MARSRFAKPEFFDDPALARCSHSARLLFVATWQLADRLGIFEWDTSKLRKYAFGYEDITSQQVQEMLAELVAGGFLRWADVSGRRYGYVVNLAKHQKFHIAEQARFEHVSKEVQWRCEHPASTLLAPTQHPASTVSAPCQNPFPLRLSLETETETETETDQRLAPKKIADAVEAEIVTRPEAKPRKTKTPSAPVADAPGFAEVTRLWFTEYEKAYGSKPAWGPVNGRKVKELLGQSTVEELRYLIPSFFAWKHPDAIKGGHSMWKGHASLIARLDELRADIAKPQRRALAAVVKDRQHQSEKEVTSDDQAARVAAKIIEARNGNNIGTSGGHLGANIAHGRNLQPATVRQGPVVLGRGIGELLRTGTNSGAGERLQATQHADTWGRVDDDPGGDQAEQSAED